MPNSPFDRLDQYLGDVVSSFARTVAIRVFAELGVIVNFTLPMLRGRGPTPEKAVS